MPILVLMRHGATLWGQENRFAGWSDTLLSETGIKEAHEASRILKKAGLSFDICFTSKLKRAQQTLEIVADSKGPLSGNTTMDWRLNERHYGVLQGETRADMVKKYGNQQVVKWRRSYAGEPPPLMANDPRWQEQLQRLPGIALHNQPKSESMAAAAERVTPLWHEQMVPKLKGGKNLLVVAHTSSIRGLVRAIEGLSDEAAENFRIATAIPLVYVFDEDLRVIRRSELNAGMLNSLRYWVNRLKPRGLGQI